MSLPELAIRRPITMFMVLISIVVLGIVALFRLPLGFLPEMQEPELFVRIPYPNATPEQVERMIIRPLEETLATVKGLERMWSSCDRDGGVINLEFDWGHSMHLARAEIKEKIDRTRHDLPDGIGDITVSSNWDAREADEPVLEGRLSSYRNLSESYDLLERKIVKPLERIHGVAQVRLDGVNPQEVRINLRARDLEAYNVDIRRLVRTLQNSNFDQSLGEIETPRTRFTARTVGTFSSLDEIRDLVIRDDGLRLQDVADVLYEEPPLEYGRHLNGSFAVGISVSKEAGANAVTVCDAIEATINEMEADPELEGIDLLIWFNQGQEIRETLSDLSNTGIYGAILASLVLFAFLRRVSITVISVLCIPFSLVVACGIIWAQGKSLNTITLLGLIVGIGMLVDNAVVVIENIFRHQQHGEGRLTATRRGAKEVATAVVAATSTSIIVFLPIIFNKPSWTNIILKELGITVCLTLLASLFISQTLIPLATSRLLRARPQPKSRIVDALEKRYVRVLEFNLRHRWLTPLIGIMVILSAVYPFLRVDKNFDMSQEEAYIQLRYEFSEELSLERKEKIVTLVEEVILPKREALGLKAVYSFWSDRFTVTRLYMEDDQTNEAAMMDVRNKLRPLLPEIPGLKLEFRGRHRGWHRGGGKRIAFQIVGEDSGVLAELSEEVERLLEQIPGLKDPWASSEEGGLELHVDLDRALAANFGVPLTQPAEVISLTFRGRRLQRFRTPAGEREMWLTLDEQETESLSQLRDLPIWTDEGTKIPLASVAAFHFRPSPERIERDNRRTSVWVGARYETGTSDDYLPHVKAALESVEFPYGYSWTFHDWEERRREQSMEFLTDLILALMLVFAVMAGLFESVRQAVGLMVALPFALAGAVWTLFITGTDFDQPASIGLLLLIGVVVNNGIVMLAHINHYRREGLSRHEAMILGGRERLRPILMTAITTIVGLVPMAVQKPSLGDVYYYSMALVIMGGLFVSTFLTSVLLPTNASLAEDIFGWVGKAVQRIARRKSNRQTLKDGGEGDISV